MFKSQFSVKKIYVFYCTFFSFRLKNKAKMKAYSRNPWLVENIDDFNFLCCPECAYKSKDEDAFIEHAFDNHPKSKESLIFRDAEEESSEKKTIQNEKKVVKVISPPPKNVANINMPEREDCEKNQVVELEAGHDFTELDSIKDEYHDGELFHIWVKFILKSNLNFQ